MPTIWEFNGNYKSMLDFAISHFDTGHKNKRKMYSTIIVISLICVKWKTVTVTVHLYFDCVHPLYIHYQITVTINAWHGRQAVCFLNVYVSARVFSLCKIRTPCTHFLQQWSRFGFLILKFIYFVTNSWIHQFQSFLFFASPANRILFILFVNNYYEYYCCCCYEVS